MKKHTWQYALKSGVSGLAAHPLLSFAAITTLALMLFLVSAFLVISINANHLSEIAAQQPPIEATMRLGVSADELAAVESFLDAQDYVLEYQIISPRENFEQFKEDIGKDELWDDFDYEATIPYTVSVRLRDPAEGERFERDLRQLPAVADVMMESTLMGFLERVKTWTGKVGLIVFIVLALIASVVMFNTMRISVFSRSEEINIMKYVGATHAYIRVPFIVEGTIIGVAGALLASTVVAILYNRLVVRLNPATMSATAAEYALLPSASMTATLFGVNLAIALVLCIGISSISVRKYAKV
ncbi:MAG: cell division protein FtsX [Saccharofermentanales bacterium]|jgi:cell division transport system permease protein